jgi:hypothetical protein
MRFSIKFMLKSKYHSGHFSLETVYLSHSSRHILKKSCSSFRTKNHAEEVHITISIKYITIHNRHPHSLSITVCRKRFEKLFLEYQ